MKTLRLIVLACAGLIFSAHAAEREVHTVIGSPAPEAVLIPKPQKINYSDGYYDFDAVNLIYDSKNQSIRQIATQVEKIFPVSKQTENYIDLQLALVKNKDLGPEGYKLTVGDGKIRIEAEQPAGLFYGTQTLFQLVPQATGYEQDRNSTNETKFFVNLIEIEDAPRFPWRGMMLDVSRHWFTKKEVMRYIDQIAEYKFNRFHWHLTDDQGWRIQIDALPRLTEIGAWRAPRVGGWWGRDPQKEGEAATYGGFYTKADIAEVIEYARQKHITVVPEIDVPGHSLEVLVAYPELACFPETAPTAVNVGNKFYGIDQNTLCVGNPKTMEYMEKIFSEVADMFPSEYIHVGGDEAWKGFWKECPKCQALMKKEKLKDENELQSYFIRQMEQLLKKHGKKLIGWDEIHEGGLAPEATVMSWRGMQGGIDAAKQGHHVIMTPNQHCYLDLYQGEPTAEPPTYSMCRLTDSYNWDPVPEGVDPEMILGGQGNLWAEAVPHFRQAEYMSWPRGWALAEVFWTNPELKNWENFIDRAEYQIMRNQYRKINVAESMYNAIVTTEMDSLENILITLDTEIPWLEVYYSFDDMKPDAWEPQRYTNPLTIPLNASRITIQTYYPKDRLPRKITSEEYNPSLYPAGKVIQLEIAELKKRAKKVERVIGNL